MRYGLGQGMGMTDPFYTPAAGYQNTERYAFELTGQIETHNGVAWTADITKAGVKVGTVENHGTGGPNFHVWTDRVEGDRYVAAAKRAFPDAVEPDTFTTYLDIEAQLLITGTP